MKISTPHTHFAKKHRIASRRSLRHRPIPGHPLGMVRNSSENQLERYLTHSQWQGFWNYYQRVLELGGNPERLLSVWKEEERIHCNPEWFLDETREQQQFLMAGEKGKPLKFGPGILFHNRRTILTDLKKGAVDLEKDEPTYFTRGAHTYGMDCLAWHHPGYYPAIFLIDTAYFNELLGSKNASLIINQEGIGWHPYPAIQTPIPWEKISEVWVREDTHTELEQMLQSSSGEREVLISLEYLFSQNKIKPLHPNPQKPMMKRTPWEKLGSYERRLFLYEDAVIAYLLERNLWMQIPLMRAKI